MTRGALLFAEFRRGRRRPEGAPTRPRRARWGIAPGVGSAGPRGLGEAIGEECAGADRAVEARPPATGAELLLQAVEAPEPPAEVVDHVDDRRLPGAGDDGAAVLERAVVGEDDVPDRLRKLGGNPAMSSISLRIR